MWMSSMRRDECVKVAWNRRQTTSYVVTNHSSAPIIASRCSGIGHSEDVISTMN